MNFELTEEQNLIRDMVREFAEAEVAPTAKIRDEEERFDRALMFDKLGELGLTGIVFPEEYGGAGADYISYAIAVEELSRVCASTGVTLSAHLSLCANPIYLFGSEEQKQQFLVPLAKGEKMGAFGLTEPSAGSDAGGTKTTAVREGDKWILNGTKIFITNGGEAETYVVFARTDKDAKKHHGISAFIVEKGTPGFSFGKKEQKFGIRSSPTLELIFENCSIPAANLLGEEGQGFKIAMKTLDGGRIGIASQALGIAQGALDVAVNYAKERKQFDTPIGKFQGVQFQLADMATQIEAARLLVYNAAYRASNGLSYSQASAMAKLMASETAMKVTTQAVQILGGYGYTRDFPVERMMRDAKITEIYEGTSEIQRLVIGASLLQPMTWLRNGCANLLRKNIMKILVCIKQVPDMESKFKIDDGGTWFNTTDLAWRMNEYDEYAVEQAVQLKEQTGDGDITVLCIGSDRVKETMKKALAMGCDRGVHVNDESNWTKDALANSSIIAEYAKEQNFDYIFTGMQSQDRGSGQTGICLPRCLACPALPPSLIFPSAMEK